MWYEGCGKCWHSKGSLEPLLPALLTIKKKIEPPESGKVSSFNRMAISSLPNKSEGSKRTGSYPAPKPGLVGLHTAFLRVLLLITLIDQIAEMPQMSLSSTN